MTVELTRGAIYNTPSFGGNTAPNGAFVSLVPALGKDSFVTMGGLTSDSSQPVLVVGGAVNLPGAPAHFVLNNNQISVTWAPAPGVTIEDQMDFLIAQISLTDDAEGLLRLFSSTDSGPPTIYHSPIYNGHIEFYPVPEPASGVLLLAALFGIANRRVNGR
ncbi:PEP-CTERM sorting domain-containing protein [Botrimarina hoheduenensis]|uniref:PEP-CTERM protein-sorting domain-containing protein n=1 Tax=Botrimarina hoheduenensis TaxID=2528000 RepID=A0A5C5WAY1_9BACT|nr:PEP-CTERM sorting domain-containing protein [Botrimarina hoheduenensis]TWT47171.1 hypothetical protein Pla111_07820 [Botrimarina hoheduenensis]